MTFNVWQTRRERSEPMFIAGKGRTAAPGFFCRNSKSRVSCAGTHITAPVPCPPVHTHVHAPPLISKKLPKSKVESLCVG